MLVSYQWLKKYVKLPDSITPEDLALKLTLGTVEVEGIKNLKKDLVNIVVGKVITVDRHPDADKLKVCAVDIGTEKLSVVCGGVNVRPGMLVALAKVGARVRWHGEGELVELAPTKIRGVESQGMICSGSEIGLAGMFTEGEKEILDLTDVLSHKKEKRIIGAPLAVALDMDDAVFDIDNKSMTHRPDLWGHYGLAREVAALYHRDVALYETEPIKPGKKEKIKVTVEDAALCPRYMAVKINNVKVGESPEWLKKSLLSIGQKPINNIVDITNYIIMDIAEPMHAFDAGKVATQGKEIEIFARRARDKEKIKLLDEREIELTTEDVVIADSQKPLALAGVMGGWESAISENTTAIILEAANFQPTIIRRTAQRYDARTDSSARFEKSLDPTLTETALRRAVELIKEICPEAIVVSNVADVADYSLFQGPIELSWEFLRRKIGFAIEEKDAVDILTRLGFAIAKKKDALSIRVPSWRATKDISIPEDLVEEVARIYGYDNITPIPLTLPVVPPEANNLRDWENEIRVVLARGLGYSEVYNYSFVSGEQIKNLKDTAEYIELEKPLSKERPYLRRQLLGGLLENVARNLEFFDEVKIMEMGKVYLIEEPGARASGGDELLPRQDNILFLVYAKKKDENPFIAVRHALDFLAGALKVDWRVSVPAKSPVWMHPARVGEIRVKEIMVGNIYEVNPEVTNIFDINARVGVLEINLNQLAENLTGDRASYEMPSIYPEMNRDVAFVVGRGITHQEVADELLVLGAPLKKVELFDVYQGKNIADDKKSMAYRLTFSRPDRTLTSEEVDKIMERVVKILRESFKAELRQ